ncbi:MAG: selenocysteine-specific translation elongation factor [Campylobacter sp.]|nr:selenocysteine-specific translation elongation factor [Campylobacter sp.]
MNSIIIGTAGHIDHGKTSLIKALNGVDGDRMQSEKERGITIDLSFSNLKSGENNIAFIDVPGHENLVKTMISGAYSFDACMLVVASDDSLMPQTKEHIEILWLLGVKSIILCITKCDLTTKDEQIKADLETRDYIAKFDGLEVLQTFFVSTKDELSLNELKSYLFTIKPKARSSNSLVRYYIDRVFSLKGIGIVVTGSLVDGFIKTGEKLFCLNNSKIYNVKSLQVHDSFVSLADFPNRVAINLSPANASELKKGYILSKKGFFRGFGQVDCVFVGKIEHNESVMFCVGSDAVSAKALVLSKKDDKYFVSFKFQKEMFLKFNEPFVVLANSRVIGGGKVLNPISEPLKKPLKIELLNALNSKNFIKAFEILAITHKHGFGLISSFQRFAVEHADALNIAKNLSDKFYIDETNLCVYSVEALKDIENFVKFMVAKNPYAIFSPSSIALRLAWASENLIGLALQNLAKNSLIEKNGSVYIKKGVDINALEKSVSEKIYSIIKNDGITPQAPYNIYDSLDIDRVSGDNALKGLTASKKVVRLAHNLFISSESLAEILKIMREIIAKNGKINVGILKDSLGISRKFAIAFLEYLDGFDDIKKIENDRFLIK